MAVIVDRRLWLTAEKDELVEDGDRRAAFLWAAEGSEVSEAEAKRYGYKGQKAAEKADTGSGLTVTKAADQPENKAVEAADEDKGTEPAPDEEPPAEPAPEPEPAPAEPVKKAAKRTRKATKKAG